MLAYQRKMSTACIGVIMVHRYLYKQQQGSDSDNIMLTQAQASAHYYTEELFEHLPNGKRKVGQQRGRDGFSQLEVAERLVPVADELENLNARTLAIHKPIFRDAVLGVDAPLDEEIALGIIRGDHLDHQ